MIASLARAQHGIVSRQQLLAAGVSARGIDHRLAQGRLHAVHPGIYAVGHPLVTPRGRWMAAVLPCGDGAVLSHWAAAALWGLISGHPTVIDVLMLRTATERPGLRGRRVRALRAEDCAVRDGIPVTSLERTLLDIATVADERRLDRVLRRAEEQRLFDAHAVRAALDRGRPGTVALRSAVRAFARDATEDRRLKEELERRFIELLRSNDFLLPSTNVTVETPWRGWEVDALWPDLRLVVKLDGWETHRDRESFRRDHRRTADVSAAGYRVVRLTWEQVVDRPGETLLRLERLVPRAGRGRSGTWPDA